MFLNNVYLVTLTSGASFPKELKGMWKGYSEGTFFWGVMDFDDTCVKL